MRGLASARRAYILADNRIALDAGWDDDILAQELAVLRDDGYELQLTGFSDDELAEMLPEVIDAEHAAEEERRENAVPEAANFATSAEGIAFNGAFYPAPQGFTLVDPPAPKPADFEPGRYQYSAGVLVRLPDPPAPSPTQSRARSAGARQSLGDDGNG